jgi:hypothetical protein
MKPISKDIMRIMLLFSISILCFSQACKKAVDVGGSKVALNDKNVYTTDGGAQSVLSGLYMRMSKGGYYNGSTSFSLLLGLSADELVNPFPNSQANALAYTNSYRKNAAPVFWSEIYAEIFVCNLAIKGIAESGQITGTVKQQLIGEFKFIRAFNYFYALNLYGDVPLTVTDDYQYNNVIGRSPVSQVYSQIINDLTDAQAALADNRYVNGSGDVVTERVRPNRQVVTAFLARVYLYLQDWKNAEIQSTALIANSNYRLETNLNQVFLKASREAIWQLQPVNPSYTNTADGYFLIINNNSFAPMGQLPLSSYLMQSFEAGDGRLSNWTGQYRTTTTPSALYNYAFKYKISSSSPTTPVTEYPMVLRLAEQYLIRAESRAHQNNLSGAADDVYAVRQRAGLGRIAVSDLNALLSDIARERRVELFAEWGHRWFDLKRTGGLDAVMGTVTAAKGGTWASYKALFPVAESEMLANPNIAPTPGY